MMAIETERTPEAHVAKLDMCPRCGSEDVDGPHPCRRKRELPPSYGRPQFQPQMRVNCRGCDHAYQFDVFSSTPEGREQEAVARWINARPAQMVPTQRLAEKEQASKARNLTPQPKGEAA